MRTFEFDVDQRHASKSNETLADVRRLRLSALILGLVFAAIALWVSRDGQTWELVIAAALGVAALGCVFISFWAPRRVGSMADLYAKGPLVPAVIAEVGPRGATLLGLIDVAKPGNESRPALVARQVRTLPGHKMAVGERVPSIGILSDRTRHSSDTWQLASVMPIAWGTADMAVVRKAESQIDDAEWQVLTANINRAELARRTTEGRIELNDSELPDDLRPDDGTDN
ncbi:DUF3239 domain-containing protein [Millisia brevis]|uniref:DUF3239 domain-containing protein n=1 Tax=Millisia brevis TaxID=264148 RepID=UPI00083589D0|nr:DUF3239 domain-containing protein [Millisia brevis]